MKKLIFILAVVLLLAPITEAAMTYGLAHYKLNYQHVLSNSNLDPIRNFINEVETTIDGTSGVTNIIFTPGTEPTSTEGSVYYDSSGNNLKLYNGSAWVDIDVSGASSLDEAYGIGQAITVDAGSVTLTSTDAANNDTLTVIQSDTAGASALVITNAGTGASIEIDGAGTGDDITGTGDLWTISEAGVATLVGASVGASDIVFTEPATNDVTLLADGDGILTISAGSMEDLDLNLATANTLTVTSSTALDKVNWGAVDAHSGLNTLAFDVAVANSITQAGTGATDDLTIEQTASGVDASLILQSSGTGTDALALISSVADISLVSADNITRTAADNITDVTTAGGYTLTIGDATLGKYISTVADTYSMIAVDTVTIQNTEASKDITINSVLGSVLIEGEEDAASAVLITADGGTTTSLKIHNDTGTSVTEGAGSIEILSDVGGVEVHSSANLAKAIQIVADGGATESIYVQADQGTAASAATESDAAIQLVADVGGIGLRSGLSAANSIRLEADGGVAEGIILHSNQGTSVTEGTNAVQVLADAGGIGLESNANLAKAISLVSDGGTTSSIYIQSDTGTAASASTQTDASLQLVSDLGGIGLYSALAAVDAIRIEAAGVDGQITIQNIAGTTAAAATQTDASIQLYSQAGGIGLVSGLAAVDAIRLEATAAAAQITVQNALGTTAAAATETDASIQLYSEVGGIGLTSKLDAADAIRLESNGGTSETINIHSNQGTGVASINLLSDDGGITVDSGADDAITLTAGTGGVVFTSGQTRSRIFEVTDVELDGTKPPGTTSIGTSEQAMFDTLGFDSNPNATGDDGVFITWVVPAGYVADSADLHCYWSHSNAEDAADECVIDGTVNAVAPGEAIDAAGTVMAAVTSVIADASASAGTLVKTSLDIEVELIAVGDMVVIWFFFDESACLMAASGTADVHYFEITYESTE